MAVSVGDVFAFALEQRLFGQQVINTFACRVTQTPGGVAEDTWVTNWFQDATGYFNTAPNLKEAFRGVQTSEVEYVQWVIQRVTPNPTQTFLRVISTDAAGSVATTCETANVAASITRKGLAAGRRQKGRISVAGLPVAEMSSGVWSPAQVTALGSIASGLQGVETRVAGDQVEMGFWSPQHEGIVGGVVVQYPAQFVAVVTSQVQNTVRVQRSRTIGVGS